MTNIYNKKDSPLRNSPERLTGNDSASQQANLMVRDPSPLESGVQGNADTPATPKGNKLANLSNKIVVKINSHIWNGNDGDNDNSGSGPDNDDEDERVLVQRVHYASHLATSWSQSKKWRILIVAGLAQLAMNLNTTLYSNAQNGVAKHFGVDVSQAVWGAAAFLITYAFGCELWAPWSEEFGRRRVLQMSMFLVNCFCLMAALAPNFATLIAARALGGLSTAGGSVTLAMITDMYGPDDPWFQYATNFMSLTSLLGSIVGAVVGGFIEEYLPWQCCIWVQLIFGGAVQLIHWLSVPETRSTVVMDKVAKKLRKAAEGEHDPMSRVYGPGELGEEGGFSWREYAEAQWRPFHMLLREPIVTALALLSGFSDALIFMFVQSFVLIYGHHASGGWGFGTVGVSLTFIPIGLGYVLAFLSFIPAIRRNTALRAANPASEHAQYEARLWWLNYTAPLLSAGLLIFAFVACYPGVAGHVHWFPSMIASCMIGVANYAIYMATIDYTLRAYGVYAASATGGNGWARDFLAGILTPYAVPMFERAGKFPMMMILFGLALLLTASVYVVYFKGPWLRHKSKFAQTLASRGDEETAAASTAAQATNGGVVVDNTGNGNDSDDGGENGGSTSTAPTVVSRANVEFLGKEDLPGSRAASRSTTPAASRRNSLELRPMGPRRPSYPPQGQQQNHSFSGRHLAPPMISLNEAVERIVSARATEEGQNGKQNGNERV
ncbi:MFS general substrate transporter [Apiospora marii]|uniref:MFS general substrate transporter n=1 Tax=Apiospora marii TaxID=335849 RepID=A0ABR1RL35_9PEZI